MTTGGTTTFTAQAVDGTGAVLPGTPVSFTSQDPTIATVEPLTGIATAVGTRGTAHIVAQLLTGQQDVGLVLVQPVPQAITLVSGSGQIATIGAALAQPIIARVVGSDGIGVSGVTVNFAAANGGTVGSATGVTGTDGTAQTTWTLGVTAGPQTATASVTGLTGSPVTFTATASPPAATKLAFPVAPATSGANSMIVPPVLVAAQDAAGHAATGFTGPVSVSLNGGTAGATLSGTTTVTAVAGVATFANLSIDKLGTAYTLTATSSGLTSTTSTPFDITAGPANKFVFTVPPAAARGGQAITPPIVVTARDPLGNTAASFTGNVQLSILANPGLGTLSGTTTVPAVAGVATFANVKIDRAASGYTLLATANGIGGIESTPFNVSPGPPAACALTRGNNQARPANTVLDTIIVTVTDSVANRAPGVVVGVTVAGGGGSVPAPSITTDALGRALIFWTLGPVVGTQTLTIMCTGLSGSPITVTANASTGAPPKTIALSSGNNQGALTSSVLPAPLAVLVTDSLAHPVPGVTVNWAPVLGGGTLSAATSVTNGSGIATVTWTLGANPGMQTATASVGGLIGSPVTFTATASSSLANVTWTGATSTSWTVAGNWNPAVVPVATDSVIIPSGGNQPTVSTTVTVKHLYVSTGATITNTGAIIVGGNIDGGTTISGGSVNLNGTGTLKGTINSSVTLSGGTHTVTGPLNLGGALTVSQGTLVLNGNTVVSTSFETIGSGTLTMTNGADVFTVTGDVIFDGGPTTGLLTNGVLTVQGNFTQTNGGTGAGGSFNTGPAHTTVISGATAQAIVFSNADTSRSVSCTFGSSCFGNFSIAKSGGAVTINGSAGVLGNLTVTSGAASVSQIGGSGAVTVLGNLTTQGNTVPVHFTHAGTKGALLLSPSTTIDTVSFDGTAGQQIPSGTFGQVLVTGTPTVAAGGFTTSGGLVISNTGNLTLGGNGVVVNGNFVTTNSGVLTMSSANDSLFVVGNATFSGGNENGHLTSGTLLLFQSLSVAAAGQFSATGSHVTYLVGPDFGCQSCSIVRAPPPQVLQSKSALRAYMAQQRAARAAQQAAWTSRATATRAAAALRGAAAIQPAVVKNNAARNMTLMRAPGARAAQSIPIAPFDVSALPIAFGDTSGNQFATLRVVGSVQWQTLGNVSGNVVLDTLGDVEGAGGLTIGGNLIASTNSVFGPRSVQLFGTFADSGNFFADTLTWSGTNQFMPATVGISGNGVNYNYVFVNSPTLRSWGDSLLTVGGSLIIQNSGQLRLGNPGHVTNIEVFSSLETHGSGTLRMNDDPQTFLLVDDSAYFAGGSTTGLLTQGTITYNGNFRQAGPTTSSYAATTPHWSFLDNGFGVVPQVFFATPGLAASHFGALHLADSVAFLASNVFADGEIVAITGNPRIVAGTPGIGLTTRGAGLVGVTFDGATWTLVDGDSVQLMSNISFINQQPTATQFTVTRSGAGSFAALTGWNFLTAPTGAGAYLRATDTDGIAPFVTLNFSATTPSSSGGFAFTSGGAIINGWSNAAIATWLGTTAPGDWNAGANWSTGVVPTALTDVVIPNAFTFAPMTGPSTTAAVAHNLTVNSGVALTLNAAQLTVNGDLVVQPNATISIAGNVPLLVLGNVTTDTTGTTGVTTCNSGQGLNPQSGTGHTVRGKFCNLYVSGNYAASGPIVVPGTGSAGNLIITGGAGTNLTLNGNRVDATAFSTAGSGTLTMTNANDSLVIHGGASGIATFNGGATAGLLTAGTIAIRGVGLSVTGLALDASGTHTVVFDSAFVGSTPGIIWTSPVAGHGLKNTAIKNTAGVTIGSNLTINGNITIAASVTTAIQSISLDTITFGGTSLLDQTSIGTGAWAVNNTMILTGTPTTLPAKMVVAKTQFAGTASVSLASNFSPGGSVVVDGSGTNLKLNGHILTLPAAATFTTQNSGTLQMVTAGDSVVAPGGVFFNGGSTSSLLTAGGILAPSIAEGYDDFVGTAHAGASATAFAPSGSHRVWLSSATGTKTIFHDPGTGAGGSHFNSMHSSSLGADTLFSSVFVDDSLYFDNLILTLASNQQSTAGATRLLTIAGMDGNPGTSTQTFANVALKWVDGQPAPSFFTNIVWKNFPAAFTGTVFELARTSGSQSTTLSLHNFSSVVTSGLGAGGEYVKNSGTLTWTFTSATPGTIGTLGPGAQVP